MCLTRRFSLAKPSATRAPSLPSPPLCPARRPASNTNQMDTHHDAPGKAGLITSLLGLHDPRQRRAPGACGNGERGVGGVGEDARVGGRWSGRGVHHER